MYILDGRWPEKSSAFANVRKKSLSFTAGYGRAPLRELKNLSSLDLSGTDVADLNPLRELRTSSRLDLSGTNVADLQTIDILAQRGVRVYRVLDGRRPLRYCCIKDVMIHTV